MVALVVAAAVTFNLEVITDLTRRYIHIVALVKDAPGVRIGTDVWVEGVHVGRVQAVEITNLDESVYVALHMRLERRVADVVTSGSDVRATRRRLIGEPVVRIYAGSPDDRPLEPGDTIIGRSRIQPEDLLAMGEALPSSLDSLLAVTGGIRADLEGRAPELERLATQLTALSRVVVAFSESLDSGSLGRMLDDTSGLAARMAALRTRFHDLNIAATGLAERYSADLDDGLAARLDALTQRIARADSAVARLQARIDEGEGIVARARQDTALHVAVRGIQMQLDSLVAEARSIALRMMLP